ncbi:hypothetical protein LO263_002353 [Salmonella enterica]|nr:hypothetical protein [Salmonella enterica]EIO0274177.1 hypothetical protein [Salmonella enterica]ELJ9878687.1 hypothetical protein [Salmonella enterica]
MTTLKQVHEIEFFPKSAAAKSPLDYDLALRRKLSGTGAKILGYVMPWEGVFTKVVIDFGYDVVETRTITGFQTSIDKPLSKVELRKKLKGDIEESLKKISDDLEFVCFMPKTKNSQHIHYKTRNKITLKEKIYLGRNHTKEKFTSLLTPAHILRDESTDGMIVFAKDIPFVKYHNFSKTPMEVEQLLIEKCKTINATYNGLVLPFIRYFDVSFSMTLESGETKTLRAKGFIEGKTTGLGRTRAKVKSGYMNDGFPTWFYVMKLGDSHLKYGITIDYERRMKEHKRNCKLPVTLHYVHHFEDGYYANLMEEEIAQRFFTNIIPKHLFKVGYSETIHIDDAPALEEFINDFLNDSGEKDYMGWVSPKDNFNEDTLELTKHFYGIHNIYGYAA